LFYQLDKQQNHSLWQNITNELPQNKIERPLEGLVIEEGLWHNNGLAIATHSERVDVMVSPTPIITPVLPSIGELDNIDETLSHILNRISFDKVVRIGFGLTLQYEENSHESAYRTLARFLPNLLLEVDSSDFLYQINKPTQSKTDSTIKVNRMQRWSAVSIEIFSFGNTSNFETTNNKQLFATRLELDINTHQNNSLLELTNIRAIADELIEEAMIIARG
jgi:hypothetical protein